MKAKYMIEKVVAIVFLIFLVSACEGYNVDLIDELLVDRAFSPTGLTAKVRNLKDPRLSNISVELDWAARQDVDYYVIEFSADDPDFNTIFKTVEVTAAELPVTVVLEGETVYSIRVKGVSSQGLEDSKWNYISAATLSEQIMLASELGDIKATEAILRWVAGSNVTKIVLQPGTITHDITPEEKISGTAVVTGLTGETTYFATLYNNLKVRGSAEFTTGVDIGNNTLISPADNLMDAIAAANPGDIILLDEGDYTSQSGTIVLNKSITLQGLKTDFKPLLNVNFEIVDGAANVNLIDLNLGGGGTMLDVIRYTGAGAYNSLQVKGCTIHDFDRSFIAGNVTDAIVQKVTVENCLVTNVVTNGGDFIDFRNSDCLNLDVVKSTFSNCAPAREFIRLDNAGTSNGNATTNVLVEKNTINACSIGRKFLYIRFNANVITVSNNIFADMPATVYTNKAETSQPTFSGNNYYNSSGLTTSNGYVYDNTTTFTELDPGFANAANLDFTISNQTLKDNAVGDPRWIK